MKVVSVVVFGGGIEVVAKPWVGCKKVPSKFGVVRQFRGARGLVCVMCPIM